MSINRVTCGGGDGGGHGETIVISERLFEREKISARFEDTDNVTTWGW